MVENRRRSDRVELGLPIEVRGTDALGEAFLDHA